MKACQVDVAYIGTGSTETSCKFAIDRYYVEIYSHAFKTTTTAEEGD